MSRGKHVQYEVKKNMLQAVEENKLIFANQSYVEALIQDIQYLGEWVKVTKMTFSKEMEKYFDEHKETRKNPYLKKYYEEYFFEAIRKYAVYMSMNENIDDDDEIDHSYGGGCPYEDPSTFSGSVVFTDECIF